MILRNGNILGLSPPRIERADLRVDGGKIRARAKNLRPQKGEETVDLAGNFILPGFVNAHTHLYSSLARGMPGRVRPPKGLRDILKHVWWKLDRALEEESIYYSALVGAIEAAKCGTTTIVDHHASPRWIAGSLDCIRYALDIVGLRGVLCYEVTDRGGERERDVGLEENDRFISSHRSNKRFRGMVGAHASFTLTDESLRACGDLADRHRTGVHIHVGEDKIDVEHASTGRRDGLVDRLTRTGILRKESILAHCVHLRSKDFLDVRSARSWTVHNPRSNMNNAVGHAPLHLFGKRSALGTDGFPADMFEEARCGFLCNREARERVAESTLIRFLQGGQQMVSEIFGERFDTLDSGAVADLIVIDYAPPTVVSENNLAWHVLLGMRSAMVKSVMVDGQWTVWDRRLVNVDEEEVMRKASTIAHQLWKRISRG